MMNVENETWRWWKVSELTITPAWSWIYIAYLIFSHIISLQMWNMVAYSMTKAAIDQFTRVSALGKI